MAPFGHTTQLRVFVTPDLLQYDEVWAAAGTWNDNFGANPNDIVRVVGGVVTDLKRAWLLLDWLEPNERYPQRDCKWNVEERMHRVTEYE